MLNKNIYHSLNPLNLKIDDRSIEEILFLILQISKEVTFYNTDHKKDGYWWDLLITDESFLLAFIINYDLKSKDRKRLDIIRYFDESLDQKDQNQYFKEFYILIYDLFVEFNAWYKAAVKNNTQKASSSIEFELEQAIQNKLRKHFQLFYSYFNSIKEEGVFVDEFDFESEQFVSIWNLENVEQKSIFKDVDPSLSKMNSALKRLILIYSSLYEVSFSLIHKSRKLFQRSLQHNDNHNAHTGLIIAFVKLYQILQQDLNDLTTKHLDYYFNEILQQKKAMKNPGNLFVTVDIDTNLEEVYIPKKSNLIAGQYEDGSNIIFKTDYDAYLNTINICELITTYLSKNEIYDYNSSFNLVTGYFSKTHCKTAEEVETFNENSHTFSTFGEDQLFKSNQETTMDPGEVGFSISSPVFVLDVSDRKLIFNFVFTPDSIKYISNIIIDISNRGGQSEEEVFSKIFSSAFEIKYTTESGWEKVKKYTVSYPEDWTRATIGIEIILDKRSPAVSSYEEEVHQRKYDVIQPVFEWVLKSGEFYYPYSFLSGMELQKIEIDVSVTDLNNLRIVNSTGVVDNESEFELLGATPNIGAYVQFGAAELFCKKINYMTVDWEYQNIPSEYRNLTEYYQTYNRGIKDNQFKLSLQALSDFSYQRPGSEPLKVDLFTLDESENLIKSQSTNRLEIATLKIKPNYSFRALDYELPIKDIETGYFKFELTGPQEAFGFEIYSKVYAEIMQNAASEKLKDKKADLKIDPPNEAFSPVVSNFNVSYKASTSIFLTNESALENDLDEANQLYHISPYGSKQLIDELAILNSNLLPVFTYEGELIIGLSQINRARNLNLLFEISKKKNTNYEFARSIEWFYSGHDGWKPIEKELIISDETVDLIQTGVLSIILPKDISNQSNLFNTDNFYIKACSRSKADQFGLIKSVRTNALRASEVVDNNLNEFIESLPPNSIEDFETPISGVISVNQSLNSIPGYDTESKLSYYKRVSQLLKHKNRLVTNWDYEQYILGEFSWLSMVKCLSNRDLSQNKSNHNIRLLCLKKIQTNQNVDEVKLSSAEILEIKKSINPIISPFAKIEIVNPIFEDLWVKCKVKFKNLPSGRGIIQLNKELFDFMCPWLYKTDDSFEFLSKIKKSKIINFIKSRSYIQFVTSISILHIKVLENGSKIFYDSALDHTLSNYIDLGSDRSVVIPRSNHQIKIIEDEVYQLPEPIDYKDLEIDENFIVSSHVETSNKNTTEKVIKEKKITLNLKF